MVYASTPNLTDIESLKKEALTHLNSSKSDIFKPLTILIIDSTNQYSWLSIPALSGFELKFVNSVHYLLRTGIVPIL